MNRFTLREKERDPDAMTFAAANGSIDICACPEAVWNALHDAERLVGCIPGCDAVRETDATHYRVRACVRFGPIRVGFDGTVAVAQGIAPSRLTLVGEGRAGRAGAASGTATIQLREHDGGCRLTYRLEAVPAGPLAQLGPVVLSGMARTMSALFARRFAALFDPGDPDQPRRRTKASRSATISPSS